MDNITFEIRRNQQSFSLDALRKTFKETTEGMSREQKIIYATDMTFLAETIKKEIIAS